MPKHYVLQLLLERRNTKPSTLRHEANQLLSDVADDALSVTSYSGDTLLLTLTADLAVVDKSHALLIKGLSENTDRRCCLLRDDAGDEIRKRAYPALGRVEQTVRAFLNRAMIEIEGFDWIDTMAPKKLKEKAKGRDENTELHGGNLLERLQFDDLVALVTVDIAEWSPDRELTASDLLAILDEASSVDEVREGLDAKVQTRSFWHEVFSRYFRSEEDWQMAERLLAFIIPVRHKVMHHRPMRLGELETLRQKARQLDGIIQSTKPQLTEPDLKESRNSSCALAEAAGVLEMPIPVLASIYAQQRRFDLMLESAKTPAMRHVESEIQKQRAREARMQSTHLGYRLAVQAAQSTAQSPSHRWVEEQRLKYEYLQQMDRGSHEQGDEPEQLDDDQEPESHGRDANSSKETPK